MKSFGLAILAFGLLAASAPVVGAQETGSTTFTLYAVESGGQFYFEGEDGTKNPTLVVPAGEEITVTLINRGASVHNIHVDGQAASDYIQNDGEQLTYTFTAPASGSKGYWCDPHKSSGMAGTVRVAGSAENGDGGNGGNDSPGFQVVGLAIALVGAALLLRRRS